MTKNNVKLAHFGHQVNVKIVVVKGNWLLFETISWKACATTCANNILVLIEFKVSTWAVVVLTWIARVIFCVILAKRGESKGSAKRELGASARAPIARRQLKPQRKATGNI